MDSETTNINSQRNSQESDTNLKETTENNLENSSKNEDSNSQRDSLALAFNSKQLSTRSDSIKSSDKCNSSTIENTDSKNNLNTQDSVPKLVNLYANDHKLFNEDKPKAINPFITSHKNDLENLLKLKDKQLRRWIIATVILSFLSATLLGIILLLLFVF